MLTCAGKGEGLGRITITVVAEDVRQFWRRGSGRGDKGVLKALEEHLPSAIGFRIRTVELVTAATGGFVLAVEGKTIFFCEGEGSMVGMVLAQADKERAYVDTF